MVFKYLEAIPRVENWDLAQLSYKWLAALIEPECRNKRHYKVVVYFVLVRNQKQARTIPLEGKSQARQGRLRHYKIDLENGFTDFQRLIHQKDAKKVDFACYLPKNKKLGLGSLPVRINAREPISSQRGRQAIETIERSGPNRRFHLGLSVGNISRWIGRSRWRFLRTKFAHGHPPSPNLDLRGSIVASRIQETAAFRLPVLSVNPLRKYSSSQSPRTPRRFPPAGIDRSHRSF